jgi:nitrogen fixation/metabolism regulation signal transduction histidine kinase
MKIKTKLLLGFGLLFVVVVFFGIVSIYYIEDISEYSKTTVKNNYQTLTFARDMRAVLDENDLPLSAAAAAAFDNALKKQENNITEPGEKEATAGVRKAFSDITDQQSGLAQKQQAERTARLQLKTIEGLNMKAIVQKNNYIHDTVSKATFYLGGIVFVTFLILFVFIINFPGFILNPLNQFIDGVHDIREKNYDARLEFNTGDEFAALAREFNAMAAGLSEQENASLTKIIAGENQLKIVIEEMNAPVFGLNEKQEVLFMNTKARAILKVDDKPVNGLPIRDVVKSINLLTSILESKDGERGVRLSHDGQASKYQVKKFEIVVPNLKPKPFETLQFASYAAGMIYLLKNIEDAQPDTVKAV